MPPGMHSAMSATSLYVSTCRYVIQANPYDPDSWSDLCRYLPYLRQALTCYVCAKILTVPMCPTDSICQHNVCRRCIGGKMRLKPSCSWCKDFSKFQENPQLRIIVQCFKKLCEYIASSAIASSLSNTNNGGTNALMAIIQEGMAVNDNYTMATGPALSLLPPTLQKVRDSSAAAGVGRSPAAVNGKPSPSDIIPVSVAADGQDPENRHASEENGGAAASAASGLVSDGTSCSIHLGGDHTSPRVVTPRITIPRSPRARSPKTLSHCTNGHSSRKHKSKKCNEPAITEKPLTEQILSDTVAAEHDYNKGPPSDEESESPVKSRTRQKSGEPKHDKQAKRSKAEPGVAQNQTQDTKQERQKRQSGKGSKLKCSGCRCGLATPNPGKLTCCGQRCPCYSAFKGCVDCRCRGCRNPRGDPSHRAVISTAGLIPLSIQVTQIKQEESDDTDIDIDV